MMRKLIGAQIEEPGEKLDRGQELMMYMLLDKRLGVISSLNDASGINQTGFLHAVYLAMCQHQPRRPDSLFDMIMHWDERVKGLNKKLYEAGYDANGLTEGIEKNMMEFRQKVMLNLLNVSLKISTTSTGVMGLNWGKGMQENLIPLNFLPPKVTIVNDDGTIDPTPQQILSYDKDGLPKGLTEVGHQIITQLSDKVS